MLSYQHGFHAGNHADVLKHWLCVMVAQYMGQKGKPFWYVDTHSASGMYKLGSEKSKKTAEFEAGINVLWDQEVPDVMQDYMDLIKKINPHKLKNYPGSPWFVRQCLGEKDKARLFELHPQDFSQLSKRFEKDKAVKVERCDGFAGLKALLPPPPRRAMVVIDPPYEQASEYKQVETCLKESMKRFSQGVYVVWYPLINRNAKKEQSEIMVDRLKRLGAGSHLDVRFWVNGKDEDAGMYGSGLFVLNPPWNLKDQLEKGLPFLVDKLGTSSKAGFNVEYVEH